MSSTSRARMKPVRQGVEPDLRWRHMTNAHAHDFSLDAELGQTDDWDADARRRRRLRVRLRRRATPKSRPTGRRHGPRRAPRSCAASPGCAPSSRTSPRSSTASSGSSASCSSASGPRARSRTPRTPWPSSRCSPRPPAPRCSRRSTSAGRSPTPRRTSAAARSRALARDRRSATGADTVICDGELAPSQLRNLEDKRQGQGRRPDRADPRHLRPAREVRGGPGAGRAGPAAAT